MEPPTPVAAVCIPAWRPDPGHLAAAVAAALAQAAGPLEVVVSVEAGDRAEVDAIVAATPGSTAARVVVQPDGLGMVEHWNAAVAATTAPIVVVPGQDDVLRPGMLRTHLAVHDDPAVAICASAAALADPRGGPPATRPGRVHTRTGVLADRRVRRLDHDALVRIVLRNGNVVGAPAQVTFRRVDFDAVGGFDPRYEHAADADLWLRLAGRGDALLLAAVLGTRRVHAGAATVEQRRLGAAARDRARLAADHGAVLDGRTRAQAQAARTRWSVADAARAIRRGDLAATAAHLADAGASAPKTAAPWWQQIKEVLSGQNEDA